MKALGLFILGLLLIVGCVDSTPALPQPTPTAAPALRVNFGFMILEQAFFEPFYGTWNRYRDTETGVLCYERKGAMGGPSGLSCVR